MQLAVFVTTFRRLSLCHIPCDRHHATGRFHLSGPCTAVILRRREPRASGSQRSCRTPVIAKPMMMKATPLQRRPARLPEAARRARNERSSSRVAPRKRRAR
jgi:hypothetical protein